MCYILDQIENRGINKGIKQGLKQGVEQGSAETKEEIILKMLEDNLPDENIKQYTGVTTEELEKIKEKLACTVTK